MAGDNSTSSNAEGGGQNGLGSTPRLNRTMSKSTMLLAGNAAAGAGAGSAGGNQTLLPAHVAAMEAGQRIYENTYKMKPDQSFKAGAVKKLLERILHERLTETKYSPEGTPALTKNLTNEILAEVKKMEFDRYKIVVDVTIGELSGQGMRVASRCVWDTSTDSYASASFKNATLWAVAIVFGCYFE